MTKALVRKPVGRNRTEGPRPPCGQDLLIRGPNAAVPVAGLIGPAVDSVAVRRSAVPPTPGADAHQLLDRVRVHYNSAEPARLHARAFARGWDIHLGPGQDRALRHELVHLTQQWDGRVRPDGVIDGTPVSVDPDLEAEAADHRHLGARESVGAPSAEPADSGFGEVAQLLIISPPAASLDTIITLAIYQQLRSGTDDRVASFELFKAGGLDLTQERAIHIQGHGSILGQYEKVASGLQIGQYLKGKVPDDVMIYLDYCYSNMAAPDVKAALPTATVLANKTAAVTQGTGEVMSKLHPVPAEDMATATELAELVKYIVGSDRWKNADRMTAALRSDLLDLQHKGAESVDAVTGLFRDYGKLIWADIGFIYGVLYHYNRILSDPAAKTKL